MDTSKIVRALPLICCIAAAAGLANGAGSDCRKWKVGTSIRLSPELTANDFKALKQAGITAVEFGVGRADAPEAAAGAGKLAVQVHEWAKDAGVEIWSVHIPFAKDLDISNADEQERRQVLQRITRVLDAYAPLRAKKLVIHGSYEISKPIPSGERQARIAASRKSLAVLAAKAKTMDAQLALECLPRSCLGNTSQEIQTLADGIPSLGICLDTNHLLQEKNEDFIAKIGRRIVTLHVSDYDRTDEKHWLPGQGVNNWNAIVEALQDADYRGPFLFECRGTPGEKMAVWSKFREAAAQGSRKTRP
jgi:sugar phosphate isomerase/epimerase